MGGGNVHQSEDLILAWFLSWYDRTRSCFGRIGMGVRFCVKTRIILWGGLTMKQCVVKTHGSHKWYPLTPEETFFYCSKGGIAFS